MTKAIATLFFVCMLYAGSTAQIQDQSINWMSLDEAWQKSQVEKKKILVDMYTDWCHWCMKMDTLTFRHPKVVRYINEKYYAVKLNGEHKEDIVFKGKTYSFVKARRSFFSNETTDKDYHELAAMLTAGKIGYPTIIFLDENFETIQSIQGFKNPKMFLAFISYIGQDYQKKMPWNQFYSSFQIEDD